MLDKFSTAVRMLSCDQIRQAKSGHTGIALGASDIITSLYKNHLVFNPNDPKWEGRDRFILSAGHGSAMLYAIFYLTGYRDITVDDLKSFRQLGTKCAGHPELGELEGVEISTGPLGQGVANAVGIALGQKILQARYGELFNSKTYCLVGDGCLMEGISYEAMSLAGHLNLNNLVIIQDDNKITSDGKTDLAVSEDMKLRCESCGFEFLECDGHNIEELDLAFEKAKKSNKPVFIQAHTHIGYGSLKQDSNKIHALPLSDEEFEDLKKKFNWNEKPFEVGDELLKEWRNSWKRNEEKYNKWQNYYNNHDKKDEINNFFNKNLKLSQSAINVLLNENKDIETEATRKSSSKILEKVLQENTNVIGGTADLGNSIMSFNSACNVINKNNLGGNYIHYGIREHAMGGIMNGLSTIGFVPYAGTFLVFSDYYKNSIRMSALMNLSVIQILTHDSFYVGEDGATHQPVEHLDGLRMIPNLLVFRPCDMEETIECYKQILQLKKPSAIVLTRQNVKQIHNKQSKIENGAYTIYSSTNENECDITILTSGSETQLSIDAVKILEKQEYKVRIVSIYCYELLKQLSKEEQDDILYKNTKKIIAIEAGLCLILGKLAKGGLVINIEDFGRSAKNTDLAKFYGFTDEQVAEKISSFLKNS